MADISKIKLPNGATYNLKDNRFPESYLPTHPEYSDFIKIPFINNDIAFLLKRGGSAKVTVDGTVSYWDLNAVFDGSPSYFIKNISEFPNGKNSVVVIELILHNKFRYGNTIYVDHGSPNWRAKNVKIETALDNEEYTVRLSNSSNMSSYYFIRVEAGSNGFNKIRLTFTDFAGSQFRIACIGVIYYGSNGLRETFLPKDGGGLYGTIYPSTDLGTSLGTSANRWSNVLAKYFNGHLIEQDLPEHTSLTWYGTCSTAAGTAAKTVSISGFKLVTGAVVWVRFTATNSAAVANLTLNVNSTGAKNIKYRNGNLSSAGLLAANRTYPFVYDGTYWQLGCDLDINEVAQYVTTYAPIVHCGSTAIDFGKIIVAGTDGMYKHLSSGTAFDMQRPIFRSACAISANSWGGNNQVYTNFDLRATQSITLIKGEAIYIKGHLNGTVFTPISTAPLTQTIPTSADGCQYIYLGVAYSSSHMWLDANHPIYQFRDGKFALYEELPNDTLDIQKKQYIQQLKDLCLFAEIANG